MQSNHQGITFSSHDEATRFRQEYHLEIEAIKQRVTNMPIVQYAEVWLNEHSPSFVAGFDSQDHLVIKVKLHA